jgi:hypothetical protein
MTLPGNRPGLISASVASAIERRACAGGASACEPSGPRSTKGLVLDPRRAPRALPLRGERSLAPLRPIRGEVALLVDQPHRDLRGVRGRGADRAPDYRATLGSCRTSEGRDRRSGGSNRRHGRVHGRGRGRAPVCGTDPAGCGDWSRRGGDQRVDAGPSAAGESAPGRACRRRCPDRWTGGRSARLRPARSIRASSAAPRVLGPGSPLRPGARHDVRSPRRRGAYRRCVAFDAPSDRGCHGPRDRRSSLWRRH